jgi:hypothetical protein
MTQSSSARTWATVGVVAGALAFAGFLAPWFFTTGAPSGEFAFSGLWLAQAILLAPFLPYFTFSAFYLLFVLFLLLLIAGLLLPFLASLLDLLGRPVARLARLRVGVTWAAIIALLCGIGLVELVFQISLSLGGSSGSALIPGVGVWLMGIGFVATLIADKRSRRADSAPQPAPQS